MLALVVGNGESRSNVLLEKIPRDITIGCNALVRDHIVDHLICVDRRMVREALSHKNCPDNVYTRQDWLEEFRSNSKVKAVPLLPYKGSERADDAFHWGSGPYAVLLAAQTADEITLLGFDLWSRDKSINNIYKNTNNYNPSSHRAIDPRYWIHQISKVFHCFPDKYFIVYNKEDWSLPDTWRLANVSCKNIDLLCQ